MDPSKTVSGYGFGLVLAAQKRQLCDKLSCAVSYDCAYILLSVRPGKDLHVLDIFFSLKISSTMSSSLSDSNTVRKRSSCRENFKIHELSMHLFVEGRMIQSRNAKIKMCSYGCSACCYSL